MVKLVQAGLFRATVVNGIFTTANNQESDIKKKVEDSHFLLAGRGPDHG